MGLRFEKEVVRALNLATSLPDNEYKQDLLNVRNREQLKIIFITKIYFSTFQSLQFQLQKLKQQVTENCHAVIFSMLVDVE